MKKIILILIICCSGFLCYKHFTNIEALPTEIDQISDGINQLSPLWDDAERISFVANSPGEMKIHFESQYIVAPLIIDKENYDNKFLLYIEDLNHPANVDLPINLFTIKCQVKTDRYNFILFEKI